MEASRAHWSARVRERALWRDAAGRLPLELSGGAETGHFIWICPLRSAAHRDILLEVEGLPVSGLLLSDVLNVLNNCEDPIRIKTVKSGDFLTVSIGIITVYYIILYMNIDMQGPYNIYKVKVNMLTSENRCI